MPPRVFVTRPLFDPALQILHEAFDVRTNEDDRVLRKEETVEGVRGCQGLLCLLTDAVDGEVMDAGELRAISNYAMGTDNVDVEAATRRGILVTNTPVGGLRETPADFTFAAMLALARRVCQGDALTRRGAFHGWGPRVMLGTDVHGKTLGLVGAGRIGSAVARRAQGFGMEILYASRTRNRALEARCGAVAVPLEDLLRRADFVTLHVPLAPETHHLIGDRELRLMKDSAFLVNTSRGPVVDEGALAVALREGRLRGAALDVYEAEPEVHPDLLGLENVLLTPHMASASQETRTEMAVAAAENLRDALEGRTPRHLVNPEALSYRGGE